jgi:hypothetical protein
VLFLSSLLNLTSNAVNTQRGVATSMPMYRRSGSSEKIYYAVSFMMQLATRFLFMTMKCLASLINIRLVECSAGHGLIFCCYLPSFACFWQFSVA